MHPNLGFGPLPGGYQNTYYPNNNQDMRRKKILMGVAIGVGLIIIIWLLVALGSHKDPAVTDMQRLVAYQNESLRLSTKFAPTLTVGDVKHEDAEMNGTLLTSNADVLAALHAKRIDGGLQKAVTNTKTDTALTNAQSLSRLDEEYASTMADQLGKQAAIAVQAESETKNQQTKSILAQVAANATELQNRFSATATQLAGGSGDN